MPRSDVEAMDRLTYCATVNGASVVSAGDLPIVLYILHIVW